MWPEDFRSGPQNGTPRRPRPGCFTIPFSKARAATGPPRQVASRRHCAAWKQGELHTTTASRAAAHGAGTRHGHSTAPTDGRSRRSRDTASPLGVSSDALIATDRPPLFGPSGGRAPPSVVTPRQPPGATRVATSPRRPLQGPSRAVPGAARRFAVDRATAAPLRPESLACAASRRRTTPAAPLRTRKDTPHRPAATKSAPF